MLKSLRWGAALLLLPLAACNTNLSTPMASTVPQPMPGAITASAQDQAFVQQATSSDTFEIGSARLALQRSQNRPVRAFAQQMIDAHTASAQKLAALAAAKGMSAPAVLDPNQQQAMAVLQGARAGFDRAYIQAQVRAHTTAVGIFEQEINSGYDTDVVVVAQQTLPMIQAHLQAAQRLAGR